MIDLSEAFKCVAATSKSSCCACANAIANQITNTTPDANEAHVMCRNTKFACQSK